MITHSRLYTSELISFKIRLNTITLNIILLIFCGKNLAILKEYFSQTEAFIQKYIQYI